jgi:hypothetical protein
MDFWRTAIPGTEHPMADQRDLLDEHADIAEWQKHYRELGSLLAFLPEAFQEDERALAQAAMGSDPEADRRLTALYSQMSQMALWHERKAQMLHAAAIRLALHLRQVSDERSGRPVH